MNLASFRVSFPEFSTATDPFVQVWLDAAATELDTDLCGTRYDEMHGLLAAHKIAVSPHGKNLRLVLPTGQSPYWVRFAEMRAEVTCGVGRVT